MHCYLNSTPLRQMLPIPGGCSGDVPLPTWIMNSAGRGRNTRACSAMDMVAWQYSGQGVGLQSLIKMAQPNDLGALHGSITWAHRAAAQRATAPREQQTALARTCRITRCFERLVMHVWATRGEHMQGLHNCTHEE